MSTPAQLRAGLEAVLARPRRDGAPCAVGLVLISLQRLEGALREPRRAAGPL